MFGLHHGGQIKGKGGGTDDKVKAMIEEGSYIVPADTAEKAGLNKKHVPVRVSNGEHNITPDQLSEIGAAVLDMVKNATHDPVKDKNGKGLGLFLANGGLVEDDAHEAGKRISGTVNSGLRAGANSAVAGIGGLQDTRQIGRDVANHVNTSIVNNHANGGGSGQYGGAGLGGGAELGRSTSRFVKGALGMERNSGNDAPASKPASQPIDAPQAAASGLKPVSFADVTSKAASALTPPSMQSQDQSAKPAQQGFGGIVIDPEAEARRAGFRAAANQQSFTGGLPKTGDVIPEGLKDSRGVGGSDNMAGVNALAAKFDAQKPFVSAPQSGGISEENQRMLNKILTPHKGAQNGQLTANQINAARGIIGDSERNDLSMQQAAMQQAQAQANNQTALQRDAMNIQAQAARDAQQQRFQNDRFQQEQALNQNQFNARLGLEQQKTASDIAARGLDVEQAQRINDLQKGILNAKDEGTRLGLGQRLAELKGNGQIREKASDNIQKVKRPIVDGNTGEIVGDQDVLVDVRTGRVVY